MEFQLIEMEKSCYFLMDESGWSWQDFFLSFTRSLIVFFLSFIPYVMHFFYHLFFCLLYICSICGFSSFSTSWHFTRLLHFLFLCPGKFFFFFSLHLTSSLEWKYLISAITSGLFLSSTAGLKWGTFFFLRLCSDGFYWAGALPARLAGC